MKSSSRLSSLLAAALLLSGCGLIPVGQARPIATAPPASVAASASPSATPARTVQPGAANRRDAARAVASRTPVPRVKRGGEVVVDTVSSLPTLDPTRDFGTGEAVGGTLYEALVKHETVDLAEGKYEFRPGLADSWQQADPRTLVLRLRKGVTFHDGSPFNADAAKASLERMGTDPQSATRHWAANFALLEVPDPYTLKISYRKPSATTLIDLTIGTGLKGGLGPAMLPAASPGAGEFSMTSAQFPGTGPFKLAAYKPDQEIALEKFADYWRKDVDGQPLPYVDRIRVRHIDDFQTTIAGLKAGSTHLTHSLTAADLPELRGSTDLLVLNEPWASDTWLYSFGQGRDPFSKNTDLRQAIQHATDREKLAKSLAFGLGRPDYLLGWMPNWSGYDPTLQPQYGYDLTNAGALVSEAGYPNGIDLSMGVGSDRGLQRLAESLQTMWAAAGIRTTPLSSEVTPARHNGDLGRFDVLLTRVPPVFDPGYFGSVFSCRGEFNPTGYCNRQVDECLLAAEVQMEPDRRAETYRRCQWLVLQDGQMAGLYQSDSVIVMRRQLKGLKIQSRLADLSEVWLDR